MSKTAQELEFDDLVDILNNRVQWPVPFRALLSERRITAVEYLQKRLAPEVKQPASPPPPTGCRQLIEEMTQFELLEELTQLATPDRLRALQQENHREIAAGGKRQYSRCDMSPKTRTLAQSALRNLRKIVDRER